MKAGSVDRFLLSLAVVLLAAWSLWHPHLSAIDNHRAYWMVTGWLQLAVVGGVLLLVGPTGPIGSAGFTLACVSLVQVQMLVPLACRPPEGPAPAILLPFRILLGESRYGIVALNCCLAAVAGWRKPPWLRRQLILLVLAWPGSPGLIEQSRPSLWAFVASLAIGMLLGRLRPA